MSNSRPLCAWSRMWQNRIFKIPSLNACVRIDGFDIRVSMNGYRAVCLLQEIFGQLDIATTLMILHGLA